MVSNGRIGRKSLEQTRSSGCRALALPNKLVPWHAVQPCGACEKASFSAGPCLPCTQESGRSKKARHIHTREYYKRHARERVPSSQSSARVGLHCGRAIPTSLHVRHIQDDGGTGIAVGHGHRPRPLHMASARGLFAVETKGKGLRIPMSPFHPLSARAPTDFISSLTSNLAVPVHTVISCRAEHHPRYSEELYGAMENAWERPLSDRGKEDSWVDEWMDQ